MNQKKISSETFYELATSDDSSGINQLSEHIIQRMALYLTSVMEAEREAAKDCAQQAYEKVYVKISNGEISGVKDVYGYLIRAARYEYLMKLRKEQFEVPSEYEYFSGVRGTSGEEVVESLYSEEREKLLEYWIQQIKEKRKNFFMKVLKHINEKDKDVAEKLEMSHSSFRARKSRIIDTLRECVKNALLK